MSHIRPVLWTHSRPRVRSVISGAIVSVHMDYIQHPQRRTLEVYGDRRSAELDLQTDTLRLFTDGEDGHRVLTFENVRDNRFRAEHQDMIDSVRSQRPPRVDGRAGLSALAIAERAIAQIAAARNERR